MPTVELDLTGSRDDCLTIVALLSRVAPVVVTAVHDTDRNEPRIRVHAEIPSTVREP